MGQKCMCREPPESKSFIDGLETLETQFNASQVYKSSTNFAGFLQTCLIGHGEAVQQCCFFSDNFHILTSDDYKAILWTVDGTLINTFEIIEDQIEIQHKIKKIITHPTSLEFWCITDKDLYSCDVLGKKEQIGDYQNIACFDSNYQATELAIGYYTGFDLINKKGSVLECWDSNENQVSEIKYGFKKDKIIAVGFNSGQIIVFVTSPLTILKQIQTNQEKISNIMWNNNGEKIYTTGQTNNIKIWIQESSNIPKYSFFKAKQQNLLNQSIPIQKDQQKQTQNEQEQSQFFCLKREILDAHLEKITTIIYKYEDEVLISGSADKNIKLWTAHGDLISSIQMHQDSVNCLCVSPNGKFLVSASSDKTCFVFNIEI